MRILDLRLIALFLTLWSVSLWPLRAQEIHQDTCSVDVVFRDKSRATLDVRWTYSLHAEHSDEGRSINIFQGQWTSDRKCSWQIDLDIDRNLLVRGPGDALWMRAVGAGNSVRQTLILKKTQTEGS